MAGTTNNVAIKNLDRRLYRKVKALASLKGKTLSEAINGALSLWVEFTSKCASIDEWTKMEEYRSKDNEHYEKMEPQLLQEHSNQYVAIADGRILGTFRSAKQSYSFVNKINPKHGIVTRVEERPKPKVVELGWSVMEP
jgi:hypothetical protein